MKKFPIEKWPFPVLRILWTKNYQLLDVLRNAVRILAEQWPFQLEQAFHELCFLPKNRTKSVSFVLKKSFFDPFRSKDVISGETSGHFR